MRKLKQRIVAPFAKKQSNAGEHTSIESQGYLNGAVETGQRAAGEVLASLGAKKKAA